MLVVVASSLSLYSLAADKPYLETSKDGLMVGEFVRWYCPWSNVRDIAVIGVGKRIGRSVLIPSPTVTVSELVVEFYAPEDLLFDSRLFALLSGIVIKDGRAVLELATRTTMTKEKLCGLLRERWQQAIGDNEEIRA
ncbi:MULTISPECIES: hypothetical protein [unclassified Pseudodesulfovibrio]|uniref:hypothetical protein n=1 Tax=unclassified Pseudodesulfovibrio TaxID=2661612 RepID=UPI000FEBC91F|nr:MULTISPECIES: hypothetical protein [unclassified Pseudodesulfovibrio]MCJ2164206.1 hypothetical protein [Pseudodesulfovibrio sp. S3-i]